MEVELWLRLQDTKSETVNPRQRPKFVCVPRVRLRSGLYRSSDSLRAICSHLWSFAYNNRWSNNNEILSLLCLSSSTDDTSDVHLLPPIVRRTVVPANYFPPLFICCFINSSSSTQPSSLSPSMVSPSFPVVLSPLWTVSKFASTMFRLVQGKPTYSGLLNQT